jgi:hypothetical protein
MSTTSMSSRAISSCQSSVPLSNPKFALASSTRAGTESATDTRRGRMPLSGK